MEAHGENQSNRALRHVLFIANESLRIHTALADHSAFQNRHGVDFSQALKAVLLRSIYSIKGDFNFVNKLSANPHLRDFVGLPPVDWACDLDILAHDMDLFLEDQRIRGLLLAIIETARASGLLAAPGFRLDESLIIGWISDSYRHGGAARCEEPPVATPTSSGHRVSSPPGLPQVRASAGLTMRSLVGRQPANLTERQFDVLRQLIRGQSNKRIASELGITEGTVKIHLAAIFRALNVRNRTEAAVTARTLPDLAGMA